MGRAHCIRVYDQWWASWSHLEFTPSIHGIGLRLLSLAASGTFDGAVQWVTHVSGQPYSNKALRTITCAKPAELRIALAALSRAGTIVIREDGMIGFPNFEKWQRDDPTTRLYEPDRPKPAGFVYLIVGGDRVKIGYSANPWARLSELRTGSPDHLELVASWPGVIEDERELHQRFSEHRIHREWFAVAGDLAIFVADRSTTNAPSVATRSRSRSTTIVATKTTEGSPSSPSVSPLEPLFHSPANLSPLEERATPKHSEETSAEAFTLSGHNKPNPNIRARKPRLVRAEYPAELADYLLTEINSAAKTIGRRGHRKISATMSDEFAKLFGECEPTREEIAHVVAVRASKDRRGEGYGSLCWDSICVPGNFRRWLNEPIKNAPAQTGRAEPSPRPTSGGTVDLKALVGGKQEPSCS